MSDLMLIRNRSDKQKPQIILILAALISVLLVLLLYWLLSQPEARRLAGYEQEYDRLERRMSSLAESEEKSKKAVEDTILKEILSHLPLDSDMTDYMQILLAAEKTSGVKINSLNVGEEADVSVIANPDTTSEQSGDGQSSTGNEASVTGMAKSRSISISANGDSLQVYQFLETLLHLQRLTIVDTFVINQADGGKLTIDTNIKVFWAPGYKEALTRKGGADA
ncbi:hypothetical protein ACFPVX_23385 [Cohnella faecalis]|uniref:Pilus assembly protein PilO n=1 Tax=Cohnella faecalis TaxID=2315694 RepID=A0A398CN60_9BACL|nr:hypothetical protein [Cohnella faecalis]RIE01347.1 hypothetical protein D3H35_23530 [Cohnella faecalis]